MNKRMNSSGCTPYDLGSVVISGENLHIDDVVRVSRQGVPVFLTKEKEVLNRVDKSHKFIMDAVIGKKSIYGVTTAFGGMANVSVPIEDAEALQNNIPWPHKTGAGKKISISDVRASMLLRANSLIKGVSGVRLEIIERLIDFLNKGITPDVYELGSIGASGDLVPLSYIAGAMIGLDSSFAVTVNGKKTDCISALQSMGLTRLNLCPKEGLALINGTSAMTGIAANCIHDARILLSLTIGAHALFFQALGASDQSFNPFIEKQKPHSGQILIASQMRRLLEGSQLIRKEFNGRHHHNKNELEQDRYSLRCLPQFMGPVADGLSMITRQLETEMNSATDNPLIDVENDAYYYCGNFLGQYVSIGMDQLRYYMGLLAKHLDVQISMVVAPEFNNGLPPSLAGNPTKKINLGLKGLQLTCNSIMPLICFFGNSLADRFPTHAEQFNQNINSQGFGSANLARQSVDLFCQYMAAALIFGVQAADLRTHMVFGHYDALRSLSPASAMLYESILKVTGKSLSEKRPYIFNDNEQSMDELIFKISEDIRADGIIPQSVSDSISALKLHSCL
jgi:phenylalanine ammonia-lyase